MGESKDYIEVTEIGRCGHELTARIPLSTPVDQACYEIGMLRSLVCDRCEPFFHEDADWREDMALHADEPSRMGRGR